MHKNYRVIKLGKYANEFNFDYHSNNVWYSIINIMIATALLLLLLKLTCQFYQRY